MKESRLSYFAANPLVFMAFLYAVLFILGSIGSVNVVLGKYKRWHSEHEIILSGTIQSFCSTKEGTYVIVAGNEQAEVELMNYEKSYLVCGGEITISRSHEYGQEVFDKILDASGVAHEYKVSFWWRSAVSVLAFLIAVWCSLYVISFFCYVEKKLREQDKLTDIKD